MIYRFFSVALAVCVVAFVSGCGGEKPADPKAISTPTGTTAATGLTGDSSFKAFSDSVAKSVGALDTSSAAATEFKSSPPVAEAGAHYSLRLRPLNGHKYTYRVLQQSITSMDGVSIGEESAYNFTATITGINSDGSFTMQMKYDSIRLRREYPPGVVDSNAKTIVFDTRQKADPNVPASQQFKALINQNVNITMSAKGEVREISNIEPILTAILGKVNRDSLPPDAIPQLRESIKLQAYLSIIQQLFLQAQPEGDVTAGQQWARADSVPLIGIPSKMSIACKLTDVRSVNDQPVGNVAMILTTSFPKKTIDNPQVKATVNKADVHGDGTLLVNLATGFPIRKQTRIDMSLDLTGEPKTGPSKGKTKNITQRMSTGTSVELVASE